MVPGVPCVDGGNWGQDLALCEYCFQKGVGPRIIVLENQPGKQSSCLKRSHEITTEPIAE